MKFGLVKTINKVGSFKVNEDNILHINEVNYLFNNQKLIQTNVVSFNFLFNNIECFTEDRVTYIIKDYKVLNKISGTIITNSIFKNSFLLSNYKNSLYEIELFYLIENELIKRDNLIHKINFGSNIRLENNFIFQSSSNNIKSLSLLTGEHEWETNLSGRKYLINNEEQEANIITILGVYESHLLVWLAGDRLISIDTNNGTILYEILPFEGLVDVNGFQLWDFRDLFLEQETGKIIMLNKLFYYEIDILTQQVQQCKSFYTGNAYGLGRLPNMPEPPTDITFKQAAYTNYFIYFIGGYTFATNIVGIFNRKTYNIDWQKSINLLETDNFKDIQYANNKIYVLDTGNQLHIFEKEE